MVGFYLIVVVILCLLIFLKKFLDSSQKEANDGKKYEKYSYRITPDNFYLRPSLLFPNERSFFEQLKLAVGNQYDIYPQVSLISIFQPIKKWHNQPEISKLNKTIDFVLFDKNTQTPQIAIELDGESHSNYKSFNRDEFVDQIFAKFNIPLIRFNNGNYSGEDIKKAISSKL